MAQRPKEFGSKGVFQAASLSAESLGLTLSSLTSLMTSTRLELTHAEASSKRFTVRDVRRELCSTPDDLHLSDSWYHFHCRSNGVRRVRLRSEGKCGSLGAIVDRSHVWDPVPLHTGSASGVAMRKFPFGEGAERFASKFREVGPDGLSFVGPLLVAKESRFTEHLKQVEEFHRSFLETQIQAQRLAEIFNDKLSKLPGVSNKTPRVSFLECSVYVMWDDVAGREKGLLVEKMLHGKYTKWNSNGGYVKGQEVLAGADRKVEADLGAIVEESDEEISEEDREGDGHMVATSVYEISADDVIQALSHFTYMSTKRTMLVCDLQGVLNSTSTPPMFELTDPVIHHWSGKGRRRNFGRTDHGKRGIHNFWKTHQCSPVCRMIRRRFYPRPAAP